jgi:adenosylmethionine-8-amino-7-oxononanoate aminotransferase
MCAVDFVKDRATKTPFARGAGQRAHSRRGDQSRLFSRDCGDTFVLAPPLVTPDDVLDRMAEILARGTNAVKV